MPGFLLGRSDHLRVQTMALLAGRGAGFPEVVTLMVTTLLSPPWEAPCGGLGDRCRYRSGPVGSAVLGFATTGGSLWSPTRPEEEPELASRSAVLAGAGFGLAGAVAACMLRSEARARKLRVGDGPQVSKLRRWPAARA